MYLLRVSEEVIEEMGAAGDLKSVLCNHFAQLAIITDVDEANRIVVRRRHVWKDTLRAFSQPSFDCMKAIHVVFVGEEAADAGGPRREFFHLSLEAMAHDGQLFHGPPGRRSFVHNTQALASRKFFYAGLLVAVSLANGGPGFPCLAEAVFNYFCYGLGSMVKPEVEDIPCIDIKGKLERVCNYTVLVRPKHLNVFTRD